MDPNQGVTYGEHVTKKRRKNLQSVQNMGYAANMCQYGIKTWDNADWKCLYTETHRHIYMYSRTAKAPSSYRNAV